VTARAFALLLGCVVLAACVRVNVHGTPPAPTGGSILRIATYNASLYDDAAGGLVARLREGDANARKVAAVLQRVRPDVVLLNEFDYDAEGTAADLFQRQYLEVAQAGGGAALRYPYRYFAPVNTGVPSGLDLDRNGVAGGEGRDRGNDAWGYGLHPGQYGMLLLSMHPIDADAVRTFRLLKWSAMPDARRPMDPSNGTGWYPDAIWSQLRLSSKSHWDVPVRTPAGVVHVLASHPTPPVFDGPEDRNGNRNHDEIRLWTEYLSGGDGGWLCDDAGRCGGLAADARFVVLGDLNNDPVAGDGLHEAIVRLMRHPRVLQVAAPRSEGAVALVRSRGYEGGGDPAAATGDFGARVGPLRLDYVLPSRGFELRGSGVFWPAPGEDGADVVDGSDHRLVWVDLRL
jgi:endonuclease/exonuclease/phosphatase family metal-dependent hydrolase